MAAWSDDDDTMVATDDQPIAPEPAPPAWRGNPETPEQDALEQAAEMVPGWRLERRSSALDAPEGDSVEQATELPDDPERPILG